MRGLADYAGSVEALMMHINTHEIRCKIILMHFGKCARTTTMTLEHAAYVRCRTEKGTPRT